MTNQEKTPPLDANGKKVTEGEKIRRQILDLRKKTGAVEVRHHHMPLWFMKAAWPHVKHGTNWPEWSESVLGLYLDHWGTCERGRVFVNEPYPSPDDHRKHAEVAERLGLELIVSPNSWWYPGWTNRFEFRKRTDGSPDALNTREP